MTGPICYSKILNNFIRPHFYGGVEARYLTVFSGVRENDDAKEKEMSPKLVIFLSIACWVCSEELQDCLTKLPGLLSCAISFGKDGDF